jgi:hypothetical protein
MSENEVVANQKTILGHQASILENQKTLLQNQAAILKNQGTLNEILLKARPSGSCLRRLWRRYKTDRFDD